MSYEKDLKLWLNQNEDLFNNLSCCIQIWNSNQYISIKKYSIILEYFCEKLPEIQTSINRRNHNKYWNVIKELLNLEYPKTTTISQKTQEALINSLITEAVKENEHLSINIIECFIILLQHSGFKKYYEYNISSYSELLNFVLNYFQKYVDKTIAKKSNTAPDRMSETTVLIQENIYTFFKYLQNNSKAQEELLSTFTTKNLCPLSELVVSLKYFNIDVSAKYFEILKGFYFTAENLEKFCGFFKSSLPEANTTLINIFNFSIHIQLLLIEGFFISYKLKKFEIFELIKYIIRETSTFEDRSGNVGENENFRNNLICVEYFFNLLDKYSIKIDNFLDTELLNMVSNFVGGLVDTHHDKYPIEIMNIVMIILQYNSHILKSNIWRIFTKIMFLDKQNKPRLMQTYNELIVQLINTSIKLNTFQSFPINFKRELKLESISLPRNLKRKASDDVEDDEDNKEYKCNEKKSNILLINPDENWERATAKDFLYMLCKYENDKKRAKSVVVPQDRMHAMDVVSCWNDVNFAWPQNSLASFHFRKSIQQSLTFKQQLIFWNIISKNLEEELNNSVAIDEEKIFLINLYSLLSCQFLESNLLIENSKLLWSDISSKLEEYFQLLQRFGKMILKRKHNQFLINSFLNLAFYYYNFGLAFYNYCPDSINTDEENEYKLEITVDIVASIRKLDSFLTQDEWTLIEQRIANFGELECKKNMQRLNMNRVRIAAFVNDANLPLAQFLVDTQLIEAILKDNTINVWLINSVERPEMIRISEVIVQTPDICKSIQHLFENSELLKVVVLSTLKKMCETNLFNSKYTISKSVDYESMYDLDTEIVKNLNQSILNCNEDRKFTNFDKDELLRMMNILAEVPLCYLPGETKSFVLGPLLALMADILKTEDEEVIVLSQSIFTSLIELEDNPNIFQTQSIDIYLKIFTDIKYCQPIFKTIFRSAGRNGITRTDLDNFNNLLKLFKLYQSEFYFMICTILLESLLQVYNSRVKEITLDEFNELKSNVVQLLCNYIKTNFKSSPEFLEETIGSLCFIIQSQVRVKSRDADVNAFMEEYLEIYLKDALKSSNVHLFHLIRAVYRMPQFAALKEDIKNNCSNVVWGQFRVKVLVDIEKSLELYSTTNTIEKYEDMVMDDNELENENEAADEQQISLTELSLEELAKMVLSTCNLHNLDWLKKINDPLMPIKMKIIYQYRCLELFFNCIKIEPAMGKKIIKYFTTINQNTIQHLFIDKRIMENIPQYLQVLKTSTIMVMNPRRIPLSLLQTDDLLNLLIEVNLRKFTVTNENIYMFVELHKQMAEMLFVFLKKQYEIAYRRLPLVFVILEDLIQSIILFKSQTEDTEKITTNEINVLTMLTHKLEKIMNELVTNYFKHLTLLAPSLLSFIISLMTTKKQKTTLFEKVRNGIKNICFTTMKLMNVKMEKNLVLTHNEAFKEVFQGLIVEYRRYHKFRGKV